MRVGDELVEIDGMDVSKAYLAMINATISQAAKAGSIELKLRRFEKGEPASCCLDPRTFSYRCLTGPGRDRSVENGSKSASRYDKKEEIDEPSFDQKRLNFEKAAYEQRTTSTRPPLRRQSDYHRHTSPYASPMATSPPPVNRQDYEAANVGQLVARYAGSEESRFRSMSHDRGDFLSRDNTDKKPVKPVNAADSTEKKSSPFSERRRNPGKVSDFVPEIDRNPSPPSSARLPRRFASPVAESDYRVTSVHARSTPGNILNFVPESERSKGTSQAAPAGDSVVKPKNILEDREGKRAFVVIGSPCYCLAFQRSISAGSANVHASWASPAMRRRMARAKGKSTSSDLSRPAITLWISWACPFLEIVRLSLIW